MLGLNPATVTRITRDLIEDGLVTEEGEGTTKGAGRKPILLQFNHSARFVIAVQGDGQYITGIIANLASEVLHRRTTLNMGSVEEIVEALLEENPNYRGQLAVICLCLPLDAQLSKTTHALEKRYGVHILVSDKVTAAAHEEITTQGTDATFALLYLGAKSSNCVVIGGQSRVGQLGFSPDGQPLSHRLSDAGLIEVFEAAYTSGIPSALNKQERVAQIFEAARHHDPAATQAVNWVIEDLAYCVAWFNRSLGIDHIILAGEWVRATDIILPRLEQALTKWVVPPPVVSISKLKEEASLMGAVHMAIRIASPTR